MEHDLLSGMAADISAIVSLILLAEISGDLFAPQMTSTPTALIESAESSPPPATGNPFYDRTVGPLSLVMAFLAFAMEIGSGIALHEAGRLSSGIGEDAAVLRRELAVTRERMIVHGHEALTLETAGVAFEHAF